MSCALLFQLLHLHTAKQGSQLDRSSICSCSFLMLLDISLHLLPFFLQEAHKRNNGMLPPPWAILTIAILGFNEFMILLR